MCMGSCFEVVMRIELRRQYPTNLTEAQYPLIEEAQRFSGGRWASCVCQCKQFLKEFYGDLSIVIRI